MGDEGGKSGGPPSEEQGNKLSKDGDDSLWNGPVKKRCCTDIVCIPLFICHILAFWALTFANTSNAEPMKLISPRDFKGDYCGIPADKQWNSKANLKDHEKLMWSMNMDEAFAKIAKELVCGSTGYSVLVSPRLPGISPTKLNSVTKAEYEKYCGISTASFNVADAAAALTSDVGAKVEQYTDPSKAAKLFTGGAAGPGLLKQMTKYFNMVCMNKCGFSGDSAEASRTYLYSPAPMTQWGKDPAFRAKALWDKFMKAVTEGKPDIAAKFSFKSWSLAVCPYDPKYCVPMPGMTFEEQTWGQCMPKINPTVMNAVGGSQAKAMEGIAKLSATEDAKKSVGDVVGDVIKTWDVFVIVAVASLVLGMVVLVIMRFILCPMVWGSLLLIFLIFAGGGLAIMVRAGQCAEQSFSDAASTQKSGWTAQASSGTEGNPFDAECAGGFAIESKDAREAAKIAGYVVLGIAGLWLLGIIIMVCRIRLAIAVNQVACMFLYHNPSVLLVPVLQNLIGIIWIFLWLYCASFLLSQVSDDQVSTKAYKTYAEAYGTSDKSGACTDTWPAGDVWVDENDSQCSGTDPACYKCSSPRFVMDWKFGYSFFSYLWHNFFMVAVGQCSIAGAVGIWFFTPRDQKWKTATVCRAVKNALLWHSGSLAFGSLILAIVVWLKWFMAWLAQQAKQTKNKVMEIVCKILGYCLWCFEKCVKFLNKNAYIQVALMGTNFCKSAKNAFFLILRNIARIGVIALLSHIVHFIGMVLIIAATAICGYGILQIMYPDVNPIFPTMCYAFIGWMTAKLFIGTFGLAVDTTLQCFIAAEEMDAGNDFAPEPLKNFLDAHKSENEKSKCCDSCCCTIM